jgi:solute:Na+ symporter, SSS family
MHMIDWMILAAVVIGTSLLVLWTRKLTRSVADFMAANRCAGRYTLGVSEGMASLGAISAIVFFEMHYNSGFSPAWWSLMQLPIGIILAMTGWVIYRYRQTRALTLAQFFEMRYSRKFRIFAGILAFFAGIVNYGIFPAVSARFFIYFCGIPEHFMLAGLSVPTYPVLLAGILSLALWYVFIGGQIAVLISNFYQGMFCFAVFGVLIVFCMWKYPWNELISGLLTTPNGAAMVDPLQGKSDNFGFLYFAIASAGMFFHNIGWQGRSGFNASARSPHEARMAKVLGQWRQLVVAMVMMMLPLCAVLVMNSAASTALAQQISATVAAIPDGTYIQQQMTVPVALRYMLPPGLVGLFCAMMFCAMVTTDQPYLHSWGSILIQDVIIPLRKGKPLSPKQHIRWLRLSICGVALFAFLFSLLFRQTVYIAMFFNITGAIFLGGAGAVIIGGLYWRRGTTAAAWVTMITGSVLATSGVIILRIWPECPLTGMEMSGITMVAAVAMYIGVSLLGRKKFNLDQMLRRGIYADGKDAEVLPATGWKALITSEFSRRDKVIYALVTVWTVGLFSFFIVVTLIGKIRGLPLTFWAKWWQFYVYLTLFLGIATTIWFTIGGIKEIRQMTRLLSSKVRDDTDDGRVVHNEIDKMDKH